MILQVNEGLGWDFFRPKNVWSSLVTEKLSGGRVTTTTIVIYLKFTTRTSIFPPKPQNAKT